MLDPMENPNKKEVSGRSKWLKRMRKYHKWPGIILTLFIILFSTSGIIMNHRDWFSAVDINRKILPPDYQIENWNLASIKSSIELSPNDLVIYGNIGAWLTNNELNNFIDLNEGFGKGIDNRKVETMLLTSKGELLAGTLFGLYKYAGESWEKIEIPGPELRINDLIEHNDEVHILTRSYLLKSKDLKNFTITILPPPANYDNKVSLFKTLWTLHSGEMFGHWGKILVDIFALSLLFLAITGLLHWLLPKWIKRRRKKNLPRERIRKSMVKNLKLHNEVGYIMAVFLIFTAVTGMFLRPPLLIPIASAKVSKIPHSKMDIPNPWYDNLRRIVWDDEHNAYLVSTTEGFYFFEESFTKPPYAPTNQPPVSVMGCTVLKKDAIFPNHYLVGSFTGLFLWDIHTGAVFDYMKQKPYEKPNNVGSPISDHLISGFISTERGDYIVDYAHGMLSMDRELQIPAMPQLILDNTPMSLWNVALEVHTGRIFNHLIGPLYILYIPLFGIAIIMVLISGVVIWWLAYKKNSKTNL